MKLHFYQPDDPEKKRLYGVLFFAALVSVFLFGMIRFGTNSYDILISNDKNGGKWWDKVADIFSVSAEKEITIDDDPEYPMPKEEKNRWDILILGVRGEDDEDAEKAGALLTDTIIVLSYDKASKKTSMVSIPRDLYVRIYGAEKDKINSAYEIGALRKNGLGFAKKLFSRITGVYMDNAVVVDFSSFKNIIDDLGGIDIDLSQPFAEKQQWGYEFSLPAGLNRIDGQTALYYVRSRFSSSDFDRSERQQKVILAIKDKVSELNLLSDPIKTLSILNTIRKNIDTDLGIWDANSLFDLSREFTGAGESIKRYAITTQNLVYETHIQTDAGNLYVLLPKGDSLQEIKNLFRNILE